MPFVDPATQPPYLRRHPEWWEFHYHHEWLYDSWEGGPRYRNATYGFDRYGLRIYNLVRHKHERPDQNVMADVDQLGEDPTARAGEGDFEYRRARTPVPPILKDVLDAHLSKLYAREVERKGPADLVGWWADVDGSGVNIDAWMKDTISPLLMTLGQIDIHFDRPRKPDGATIASLHDQEFYKLDGCAASFILPWNMTWWTLARNGEYAECVVCEPKEGGGSNYRHWTTDDATLYDDQGRTVEPTYRHGFGFVPIVRVFDQRIPRLKNTGLARYEAVAEYQREYYNRDSELILSDTHQAFPLIQGPDDYITGKGEIPIGPTWLLPMKKNGSGAQAHYQGFNIIDFPKDGAESIRRNKADMIDAVDRNARLTKPAGATGTTGTTVAQSGISKRLDQTAGNDLLTKISGRIEYAELVIARMAIRVLSGGKIDDSPDLLIAYPRTFDLATAEELSSGIEQFQAILTAAGSAPVTEVEMIRRLVRQTVPGLLDKQYEAIDAEIEAKVNEAADRKEAERKAATLAALNPPAAAPPKQIDPATAIDNAEAIQSSPSTNPV